MPLLAAARAADRISDLRPNAREGFRTFADLVDGLTARAGSLAPAQVLEELIRAINYEGVLAAEGPEGADRWENVRELVASAAEWSEVVAVDADDPGTPLERFLAEAALLSSGDTVIGGETGVTLMTLHTAKGLEWPVVVLAGLEHGLFPLARAEEQPEGLEEERRLCYVGLTRAKDKLYLTWARARRRGGELRPGIASAFLKALPPSIVEERRTSSMSGWGEGQRGGWGGARRRYRESWDDDLPSLRSSAHLPVGEESQLAPRYVKGERVRHRRFGSGTIRGLTGGGRDLKVEVAFDDADIGIKQLLVTYAGLERDWESA
jgi:DNA helicase-2/ATP-dependent DNA helicase PcrA